MHACKSRHIVGLFCPYSRSLLTLNWSVPVYVSFRQRLKVATKATALKIHLPPRNTQVTPGNTQVTALKIHLPLLLRKGHGCWKKVEEEEEEETLNQSRHRRRQRRRHSQRRRRRRRHRRGRARSWRRAPSEKSACSRSLLLL